MTQIKKVPLLRFKGFEEEWKSYKLHELGETFTGLSGKAKDDFGHGIGKFVTYMNVFSNPVTSENQLGIIEIDISQNEVRKGDVFFTTSSETPEEVGMSSVWLGNLDNVYLNSFCFGYRPKELFDSYYLAYLLRSNCFRDKIKILAQGISRYNISKNKVMEITIPVIGMSEQNQIGNYFKTLDVLIDLQEQKHTKLKQLKKAMLDKMFPKAGAKVPEIRFKGFTEEWEEKKLGEIASTFHGGGTPNTSNKEYWDGNIPWIQSSDLCEEQVLHLSFKKFINRKGIDSSAAKIVSKDSIAVVTRVGVGKLVLINQDYATSQDFLSLSNLKIDKIFAVFSIYKLLQSELHLLQGTSIKGITKNDLLDKKMLITGDLFEQQKIGAYFEELDKSIEVNQQQIEKYKHIKQALLSKMFV